jgi:hypothetical protein
LKNAIKKLAAAVLSVTISLTTLAVSAAAAAVTPDVTNNVDYFRADGDQPPPFDFTDAATYKVGNGANEVIQDFFGEATKGLSPGDTKNITVRLHNNSGQNATFYLISTPLGEADATRKLLGDGSVFAGKTASQELLEQIGVLITHDATSNPKTLYSGTLADGQGPMSDMTLPVPTSQDDPLTIGIGTVSNNSFATINVNISIPPDLGNEYQNALAAVEWRFVVWYPTTGGNGPIITYPPTQPSPSTPAQPDAPPPADEIIEDETPPLANYEPPIIDDEVEIGEEDVPLADFEVVPETGDDRPGIFTFGTLAAASIAVIVVLLITGNKRGKKKDV